MLPNSDLRAAQVAPILGVSECTVRNWARAGRLPHRRQGQDYRFTLADVEAFRRGEPARQVIVLTKAMILEALSEGSVEVAVSPC